MSLAAAESLVKLTNMFPQHWTKLSVRLYAQVFPAAQTGNMIIGYLQNSNNTKKLCFPWKWGPRLPRWQHSLQTADTLIKYSCGHGEGTWEWTHSGWRLKKTNTPNKSNNVSWHEATEWNQSLQIKTVSACFIPHLPSAAVKHPDRNLCFIVKLWHKVRFLFAFICCRCIDTVVLQVFVSRFTEFNFK